MKDIKKDSLLNLKAIEENSISVETMESLQGGGVKNPRPRSKSRVD